MKQDNKDIFDIDFNNKSNSATSKKDTNNADFFDFSINDKKVANDKPRFHEEFSKEETPIEEIAPAAEVTPAPVQDESPISTEAPIENEDPIVEEDSVAEEESVVAETPTSEEQAPEAEIPSPAIASVPKKSTTDINEENVSITKVNWRKKPHSNTQLYNKSNASPSTVSAETPAKKKSLVIETDDGFEFKICSFRDLANK